MLKNARLLTHPTLASEEARRTLRDVEPLSDVRTPLAGFFSILSGTTLLTPKLIASVIRSL